MQGKVTNKVHGFAMVAMVALVLAGCTILENFDNCPQQEVSGLYLGDTPGGLNCLDNPSEVEIYTEVAPGETPPFLAQIWDSLIGTGNSLFTAIAQTVITFEGSMAALGVDRVQILLRGYGAPCVFIAVNERGEELQIETSPTDAELVDVTASMIGAGTGKRIDEVRIIGYECEQEDFQAWAQ